MRSEEPPPDDPGTLDEVFELLSHPLRRFLLSELRAHDQPQALADIANAIAVQQRDASLNDIPGEEIERIHTSLYHTHMPKLEEMGAVTFNQDQQTVALTTRGAHLYSYIERLTEQPAESQTTD